jgi:hypothetical protein
VKKRYPVMAEVLLNRYGVDVPSLGDLEVEIMPMKYVLAAANAVDENPRRMMPGIMRALMSTSGCEVEIPFVEEDKRRMAQYYGRSGFHHLGFTVVSQEIQRDRAMCGDFSSSLPPGGPYDYVRVTKLLGGNRRIGPRCWPQVQECIDLVFTPGTTMPFGVCEPIWKRIDLSVVPAWAVRDFMNPDALR